MKTLSIVIPVYNEENSIVSVLNKVSEAKITLAKEIIIVNDGSKDLSGKIIEDYLKKNKSLNNELTFRLINKKNGGKGSAVKAGIAKATGEIIIIQDADLEYDPNEYQSLIDPIISGKSEVVYGSRRLKKENKQYAGLSFYLGGLLVTLVTNILFFSKLTDEPTCYKTFKSRLIKNIQINGNGFEWEPEVTAKILKKGIKISEVPISYFPRTEKEGKKIRWTDGVKAIWTLVYWRFNNS